MHACTQNIVWTRANSFWNLLNWNLTRTSTTSKCKVLQTFVSFGLSSWWRQSKIFKWNILTISHPGCLAVNCGLLTGDLSFDIKDSLRYFRCMRMLKMHLSFPGMCSQISLFLLKFESLLSATNENYPKEQFTFVIQL